MTKPLVPNPEPTEGSGYDSFMWSRSKTPSKDDLYQFLRSLGWRYSTRTSTFHTPEADVRQAFGRLEHTPNLDSAWIVPPSVYDESLSPPWRRSAPILHLTLSPNGWTLS